jgi:hypothetical protein
LIYLNSLADLGFIALTGRRRFGRDAGCTPLRRRRKGIRRCGVPAQHECTDRYDDVAY